MSRYLTPNTYNNNFYTDLKSHYHPGPKLRLNWLMGILVLRSDTLQRSQLIIAMS